MLTYNVVNEPRYESYYNNTWGLMIAKNPKECFWYNESKRQTEQDTMLMHAVF